MTSGAPACSSRLPASGRSRANLTGSERPERVEVLLTGSNYFDILGARAAVGRTFSTRRRDPRHRNRRGHQRRPLASRIRGRSADRRPDAPNRRGRIRGHRRDAADVPASQRHARNRCRGVGAGGLEGVALPAAGLQRALRRVGDRSPRARSDGPGWRCASRTPCEEPRAANIRTTTRHDSDGRRKVRPLAADLVANVRPALMLLMAAIVCVLLIAVSNISNLLLVRAVEREREVAIQRALGASRARVITSLLVEGRRPGIRRRRGRLPCEPLGRRPAPSARAGATAARDRHRHRSPRLSVRARDFARRRASRRPGTGTAVRPRGRHRTAESGRPQRRRRRSRAGPQCAGRSPGRRRLHPAVRSRASRPQPLERGVGGHRHANRQAPDYPSVAAAAERSRVGPVLRPRQARRSDANHPGPPDAIPAISMRQASRRRCPRRTTAVRRRSLSRAGRRTVGISRLPHRYR